jgi:twinfilin-like protein
MASGIQCGAGVAEAFRSGGVGMLQLHIVDESVEVAGTADAAGSDEAAFDSAQAAIKEESNSGGVIGGEPCYIALKLPSLDPSAAWVMLLYIPAGSSVRDRMLYASTKDTVKKELGGSNFTSDLYGNTKDELTLAAYMYKQEGESSGPATVVEAELDDLVRPRPRPRPCPPQRRASQRCALAAPDSMARCRRWRSRGQQQAGRRPALRWPSV